MSTEESPREIAILGAGKIGRGVVGLLFSRAGYRLHLYDMYMEGMRKLEAQVAYLKKSIALKAQKRSQTGTKP